MPDEFIPPEKPSLPSDEALFSPFEKIRDDLRGMELPELPDDAELREKIHRVVSPSEPPRMPDVPEIHLPGAKKRSAAKSSSAYDYRGLGIGMSAAYTLVGSMIVGFGLGWLFDRATHSTGGQVVGALLGAVLGIFSAIWLVNRDSGGGK